MAAPSIIRLLGPTFGIAPEGFVALKVGHKVRVAGTRLEINIAEPEFLDDCADAAIFFNGDFAVEMAIIHTFFYRPELAHHRKR